MPDICTPRGHTEAGTLDYSLATNSPTLRLGEHYTLVELACKDGTDRVRVHPALVALLEAIRAAVKLPVHINSGYRTPAYNAKIGGAKASRHVMGLAADITVRGMAPTDVAKIVGKLNPGGMGLYNSFVHVDVEGISRRWEG